MTFMLGSGASIGAGAPTTTELTCAVSRGVGYARHSDGTYFKGPALYGANVDSHVPQITAFLRWLASYVSRYYKRTVGRAPTYEDLYYLIDQIVSEEAGDLESPLVLRGSRDIRTRLDQCAKRIAELGPSAARRHAAAREVMNYIACVVARELQRSYASAAYLGFIDEARLGTPEKQISVFTLNHEHVLEDFLETRNVRVIDGFGPPENSVRYWDPRHFAVDEPGCAVLKLHGSIRWFRLRPDAGDWHDERVGLPLATDVQHTTAPDGRRQRAVDFRPLLLIGTFNKIPDYTAGVFVDLFTEFRRRLKATDVLTVCGYGFGDKGINTQVIEWIYGARARRIVVVHPRPDDLRESARGAIRNKWSEWLSQGRLRVLALTAEQVSWRQVAALASC